MPSYWTPEAGSITSFGCAGAWEYGARFPNDSSNQGVCLRRVRHAVRRVFGDVIVRGAVPGKRGGAGHHVARETASIQLVTQPDEPLRRLLATHRRWPRLRGTQVD